MWFQVERFTTSIKWCMCVFNGYLELSYSQDLSYRLAKPVGNVSKAQRFYDVMCSLLCQKVFQMIKLGSGPIMRGKSV